MVAVSRPHRFLRCTGLALALFGTPPARVHPLHTTLTEVSVGPDRRTVTLTLRGFADDLALGTSRHAGLPREAIAGNRGDSLTANYLAASLRVQDRKGQRLPLTWSATRRAADVLWFSFRFSVPGGLAGVMISNATLCDIHDDQVNIVQVMDQGKRQSMLFTPGSGPKRVF